MRGDSLRDGRNRYHSLFGVALRFSPDCPSGEEVRAAGAASIGRDSLGSGNGRGICFMSKASRAKDRPFLSRLEWNGCVVPALCTCHRRFDSTPPSDARPLSFALFAVLRFVDESLLPIELLFARREHELQTAIYTKDISVRKVLHRPPPSPILD